MLFQERELVPISSLEYDFIVLHMKKTASAKSERIFPLQYGPLSVFEDIFHDADHFGRRKLVGEHFVQRRLSRYSLKTSLGVISFSIYVSDIAGHRSFRRIIRHRFLVFPVNLVTVHEVLPQIIYQHLYLFDYKQTEQ